MHNSHMNNPNRKLLVFSGAGLSEPSGIQTFRGQTGLWHDHKIEDVADYTTWKRNFDLVHAFYNSRRDQLSQVQPNRAHVQIAAWQRAWPNQVEIQTQNVDDLLERAGCEHVIHLHGELTRIRCEACGHSWHQGYQAWDVATNRCAKCNSVKGVKPAVVFFHEHAPEYIKLYRAVRHLTADHMVVVVGTSGVVLDVQTLFGSGPHVKVLNNLEYHPAIDDRMFDHVFYESVDTAILKIDALVQAHMRT